MKTTIIKSLFLSSLFLTAINCVDDSYNEPQSDCETLTVTKQVSDITSTASSSLTKYNGNDVIEAYVTSSDEGGNFYKSVSLVSIDGNTGFSIPIDNYNLYTDFEPGRKVFIKMDTLVHYIRENSSTVIGYRYNNDTPDNLNDDKVGRIPLANYNKVVKSSCEKINEDMIVNNFTITQAKNNNNINKLIEFDNVQFTDASINRTYFDIDSGGGATNHEITDADGNRIIVRTSEYATFASQKVPSGNGKLRGVLTKFGSTWQFMIRTIEDVKLNNPRVVPTYVFEEPFTTNFNSWIKQSVIGAQIWTLNATNGNPTQCADMNGFASGAQNNEDWLISPSINLTGLTSAYLKFDTAKNFTGNALQVYVSTNYTAGLPSTATWTQLSATMATSNGFVWTNSGNVSLAPYVGNSNVRVAFRYTSTTSGAAQWRVDNVGVFHF
ncbi:DUF5689 domain-containing protein [Flavobacterium terrae]|uniref:DUF5689 domain-containing protein n=1 Tax=Flavobacterium terrae TaxID=415425 RepID=A0A1M6B1J2_9FLAO|nr:DUF5689 domain-containing protein [Flavobacterium terrae]SHI42614.1 hypothetical protein SAMN05444363_0510 [Flavobacterium terrae]